VRFPCEKYLSCLLIGAEGRWSLDDVALHVERLGYPRPTKDYLLSLRTRLDRDRPRPYLVGGRPPRGWLEAKGLVDFFYPSEACQEAFEFLGDSQIRPYLEAVLISGIPLLQGQSLFKDLIGHEPPIQALEFYGDYYWNRTLLRQDEWIKFLAHYQDGVPLSIVYVSPPDYLLHHLGVESNLSLQEKISRGADITYVRLLETRLMGLNSDTARIIKQLFDCLVNADRVASNIDKVGKLIEQLRAVGLRFDDTLAQRIFEVPEGEVLDGTVLQIPVRTEGR